MRPVRPLLATLAVAMTVVLIGCTMSTLPAYSTVRDETHAALERIVDEFPAATQTVSPPDGEPFPCGGGQQGVFFTARAGGYPPGGFDAQAWVDALPTALGGDFEVVDLGVETDYPAISFRATAYGNALVSIDVVQRDDDPLTISVIGTSRCAQQPDSPGPTS